METVKFFGHECVPLENGQLHLLVTQSIGPRILSLSVRGRGSLLAELPDFVTECPGAGPFHFYGGHRLWHAPEELSRTYLPDDSPVEITPVKNGVLVTQPVEARTGLQKSMEIVLPGELPQVVILHHIANHGAWPVTCAPWAITQLKTGGVAILPQGTENTGVLPNRALALWPYTDMSEPHVVWGRRNVLVEAEMEAPFKIGFANPRGWLGYWLDGTFFVKRARYESQASYYDFGSSSEFYCNKQFVELETLGPIQTIEPGKSASHIETWDLYADIERPRGEPAADLLIENLGLG